MKMELGITWKSARRRRPDWVMERGKTRKRNWPSEREEPPNGEVEPRKKISIETFAVLRRGRRPL
jgi:hypothetical protein